MFIPLEKSQDVSEMELLCLHVSLWQPTGTGLRIKFWLYTSLVSAEGISARHALTSIHYRMYDLLSEFTKICMRAT